MRVITPKTFGLPPLPPRLPVIPRRLQLQIPAVSWIQESRTVSAQRNRRTKMIATLGLNQTTFAGLDIPKQFRDNPFAFEPYRRRVQKNLQMLVDQGVDCFRCNYSHGNPAWHTGVIRCAQNVTPKPEILVDLPGRKIRIQGFAEKQISVKRNETIIFDATLSDKDAEKRPARKNGQVVLGLNHPEVLNDIQNALRGKRHVQTSSIFIAVGDGPDVKLRVLEIKQGKIITQVVEPGILKQKKGTNFTNMNVTLDVAFQRDIEGIRLALEMGVDFLGLSFIQSVEEIREIDTIVMGFLAQNPKWKKPKYVVKVETTALTAHHREYDEKEQLLKNRYDAFEKILQHPNVEVIMLARGDLALVLNREDLHQQVQAISDFCRYYGKEVILATGVIESLEKEVREISRNDLTVLQAYYMLGIYDWVMFSGETAEGPNWKRVIELVDNLLKSYEKQYGFVAHFLRRKQHPEGTLTEFRTHPANFLAEIYNHFCRPLVVNAPVISPADGEVLRMQTQLRRQFVSWTFEAILKEDETLALGTLHHMNPRYAAALLAFFPAEKAAQILGRLTNQKIIHVYFEKDFARQMAPHFTPRPLRSDETAEFARSVFDQFRISADAQSIFQLLKCLSSAEISILLDSIDLKAPLAKEKLRLSARAIFVTLNEIWATQDEALLNEFIEKIVAALQGKRLLGQKIFDALSHEKALPKGLPPAAKHSYLNGAAWTQALAPRMGLNRPGN